MRLFRYLDAKGLLLSIAQRSLRVSRLVELNDPFEWRFWVTGMPAEARQEMESVIQQCIVALDRKIGLICFSASASESVLWSHYADRHRGGVLELEIEAGCVKVDYDDNRPAFDAREIHGRDLHAEVAKVTPQLFSRKSKGWAYEQEYRCYIELDQCPSRHGSYYQTLKPVVLRRVILGWRTTIEIDTMHTLLLAAGYSDCLVARAQPGRESYAVEC